MLRMKHLIWPFSPWRACWVWVLEMMGGPVGETASHQGFGRGWALAGPLLASSEVYTFIQSFSKQLLEACICKVTGETGDSEIDEASVINVSRDRE